MLQNTQASPAQELHGEARRKREGYACKPIKLADSFHFLQWIYSEYVIACNQLDLQYTEIIIIKYFSYRKHLHIIFSNNSMLYWKSQWTLQPQIRQSIHWKEAHSMYLLPHCWKFRVACSNYSLERTRGDTFVLQNIYRWKGTGSKLNSSNHCKKLEEEED